MNRKSNTLWLAITTVTLIAFFFRFYRLADHPLGIFFDPAINGLDAIRLMQRGGPVVFFPTNGGRESLFMYLLIPFISLFGTTPFSLRVLTATIGLLNVIFLFPFLHHLPKSNASSKITNSPFTIRHSQFRDWFAILASLVLAVSYWHIVVSRSGLRSILVPMLSVLMFRYFLKGWTTPQRRWFIISGLFMGLEGYTYSAARLLPLILLLALIPEFWSLHKSERWVYLKPRLLHFLVFVLTALIVYLPMAWYMLNHPVQFTARAGSVMVWNFLDTPADIIAEIGQNTLRVAGFFCCAGSPNPIFGLPGYPGSPPILLPFLLLGLMVAFKNWRDLFHRLITLWWLIGISPSLIAIEAPHPLRMIMAVVPTAILIALGLINATNWLQQRFPLYASRSTPPALRSPLPPLRATLHAAALILILLPVPALFRAYFIDWTKLQATRGVYDYGAVAIRDQILEQAITGLPIYLPLTRFNDSTLLYYLSGSFQRQAALVVAPADRALVISPERNEQETVWVRLYNQTATILPPLTGAGQQLIQAALADDAASPIRTVDGETIARLAQLPTDPAHFLEPITQPLQADFGPVRLAGATYSWEIDPTSEKLPVTLYWQANQPMTTEYEVLLRLVDDQRRALGNGDARPNDWAYPTTFWRPNLDQITAQHFVTLAKVNPLLPGRYWLAIALFDPPQNKRLPLAVGDSPSPDTFFIGPLKVSLPPASPIPALPQESVTFGDIATLSGLSQDQLHIVAGEPIRFTLQWEALTTPDVDYTVFAHLLGSDGNLVVGHDTPPVNGSYPTSIWSPGECIVDRHTFPTPDSLPPGQYRLAIGLYHQPTGVRLPLQFPSGPIDPQGSYILPHIITVKSGQ